MVATRRSARRTTDPPPPPTPPPPNKRGQKKGTKKAAEKDDILARHAADIDDVTMGDVTVTDAGQVASKRHRKKGPASNPGATSKRKLDETESEAEVASEAPTGDRPTDDEELSELSWLDELQQPLAQSTPKATSKPPRKKVREDVDTPVMSGKHMVNATYDLGASKSKLPAGGPAGASSAFQMNDDGDGDELAAWVGIPSKPAAPKALAASRSTSRPDTRGLSSKSQAVSSSTRTSSSGNSSSLSSKEVARAARPADTLPLRTKALAPQAFAKPSRPSQKQPFQPDKSSVGGQTKDRKAAKKTMGAVESDDEEPERAAAFSSPPKGGARPTSSHVVKIKEEKNSPRPAKLSINVVEPTPRKIDQVSKKSVDKNRGRAGKGKQKAISDIEDEDSSGVEIVEDPRQTLKPPRSQNESRSRSRSRSRSASVSRSSKTWRFEDLPEGSQPRWKSDVLPTLLRFQGAQKSPWRFSGASSVQTMQQIWDAVYADEIPHEVASGDCVHGFAGQCLSNWRSAIRAASEAVVGSFFQDIATPSTRTKDGRAAFSTSILPNYRYLYEKPFDAENKRLFRSRFFLTILGWHLEATQGAIDIPGLFIEPSDPERPIGACGLAAAALERIFMLFEKRLMDPPPDKDGKPSAKGLWRVIPQLNTYTGVLSTSQTRFTERLFSLRTTFFIGRVEKMAPYRFNAVLVDAQGYMGPKRVTISDAFPSITEDPNNEEEEQMEDGDSE